MKTNKLVSKDFRSNIWIIVILCIGMLPMVMGGYCMYILALLIPFIFFYKYWDYLFVLLCLFSITYTFAWLFAGNTMTASALIFTLIYPPMAYMTGKYIGSRFKSVNSIEMLLILLIICLGIPAILSNIIDTVNTGNLINTTRSVGFGKEEAAISATRYGIMLSLLLGSSGMMIVQPNSKIHNLFKIILFVGSVLAIFSTVHLLNRTGLVLVLISFIGVLILTPFNLKKIVYVGLVLIILALIFFYYIENSKFFFDAVDFYSNREIHGHDVSSLGGRDERMILALEQIMAQPWGGAKGLKFGNQYNYAHNLWLATGLKGGLICFIILIIVLIQFIKNSFKLIRNKKIDYFDKIFFSLIALTLVTQCMVEPIIEGLPQYFWFFLLFTGIGQVMCSKRNNL